MLLSSVLYYKHCAVLTPGILCSTTIFKRRRRAILMLLQVDSDIARGGRPHFKVGAPTTGRWALNRMKIVINPANHPLPAISVVFFEIIYGYSIIPPKWHPMMLVPSTNYILVENTRTAQEDAPR